MEAASNESVAVLEIRSNRINLTSGRYLIGSGQDCDIVIDDSSVQQRHAFLVVQQHSVEIVDLLTDSGTYIDDENICNGKFNRILKSAAIKFGSIDAQFRLIEESEGDFLGFLSGDVSDIIPMSPQECATLRHNSEIGRSRIRSIKSSYQSEFRTPNPPLVNSPCDKPACNDMFLANVTDVNIRKNIEQMSEEDDYYIPETQEIFGKKESPRDDTNDGIFKITTQEFEEDSDASRSSNVLGDTSLVVPLIRHSPILITELKNESATISKSEPETHSEEKSAVVDIKNDDTESEISILKWDESRNHSAVATGDLNELKSKEQIKEGSVTPDLELNHIRSGSTTPDLFPANENSPITNIDIEEHVFSPTQIFQPKKSVTASSNTFANQVKVSLNNSSNNPEEDPALEATQLFVMKQNVNLRRTTNSSDLLKNDDTIFARPSPKPPLTIDVDSAEYDNAEPTQPFILKNRSKPSTSAEIDDDFDQFEATQHFEFDKQKHRSVNSPLVLISDDEITNEEFCLRETLVIGENEMNLEKPSESSTNKAIPKKRCKKVVEEDDLFTDIQPTPCMGFIKLPNESVIDNVAKLFNKETNNRKRRESLVADSSDEDDNVFIKETEVGKPKKNAVNKNIIVWLKKDRKSDEAIKELNLPQDVQKKDSLSDQSTSSDTRRQRRGESKKRINSNDKISDKKAKQIKISTNTNLEKNVEDVDNKFEKTSDDATRNQKGRRKQIENTDVKFKETTEKKTEIPLNKTRSKRITTAKKVPLKTTPEKLCSTTKNGDNPEECQKNLCRRISKRAKSVPSHIVDDYVIGSDLKSKIRKEEKIKQKEKIPKASRRETVTKKLKQDRKTCPNLRKRSNDTSLDESETDKDSKEDVLKCSTGKNLFSTNTPSIRKSARQLKHRICFTRVDSSRYVDIMEKTGCIIENDPMKSTVLVAAKITRTWKMLAAIARGLPIVSPNWFKILESKYNQSYSYDDYLLKDPSAEQQYKFNLKKSLQAARKKPIFKNFTFFITPQTQPNPEEMTKIIESGGGSVIMRYPRDIQDLNNFYIISTREDDALWKRFNSDATNMPIYSSEGVMSAVMQQYINFKHHQLA